MLRLIGVKYIFVLWLAAFSLAGLQPAYAGQDIRLLIDLSGSMKQNDPRSLRSASLELLINHLSENDKAGVWAFAQQVNMLVPYGDVDARWKLLASERVRDVNSLGQRTNIGGVLEASSTDLSGTDNPVQFILISDGNVDVSTNAQENQLERKRILDTLLPKLKLQGAVIHSITLSDEFDAGLLSQLASETDGTFAQMSNLNDLESHLLEIINTLESQSLVPINSKEFFVDKTTSSLTATLFRDRDSSALSFLSPDGQIYQRRNASGKVSWTVDPNYEQIKISQPRPGKWKIVGDFKPESQISLESDIGIEVVLNRRIAFPGQSVEMNIYPTSYGKRIVEHAYLHLLETDAEVMDSNNKSQPVAMVLENGHFNIDLSRKLQRAGVYQISANVSGPDFQLRVSNKVTVLEHLTIDSSPRKDHYIVKIFPTNNNVNTQESLIQADLIYPDNSTKNVTFKWQTGGYWQAELTSDEKGSHQLKTAARVRIGTKTVPFNFANQTYSFPLPGQTVVSTTDLAAGILDNEDEPSMASGEMATDGKDGSESSNGLSEAILALLNYDGAGETDNTNGLAEATLELLASNEETESAESNLEMMANQNEMVDVEPIPSAPKPYIKHEIEVVEVLDPSMIIVVPEADSELEKDLWLDGLEGIPKEIPNEIIIESGTSIIDLLLWSLPGLTILLGFYLFFFKFLGKKKALNQERDELEGLIRQEEKKAEQAMLEEEEDDHSADFPPYDQEAIDNAANVAVEDLGKDSEHLFEEDIVSVVDMNDVGSAEAIEDDDEDVFDLGDLSDLSDDTMDQDDSNETEKKEA